MIHPAASRSRTQLLPIGFALLTLTCLCASWGTGQADESPDQASDVGLNGILPPEVPEGLTFDDFLDLHKNWDEWGEETATKVADLYEAEEPLDLAAQKALIADLRKQIDVMNKAAKDKDYQPIAGRLRNLASRLDRRLDGAEAILDVLGVDPQAAHNNAVAAAKNKVGSATSATKEYLVSKKAKGESWITFVRVNDLEEWGQGDGADASVLQSVSKRLAGKDMLSDAQRKFLSREIFTDLEDAINDYLAVSSMKAPKADANSAKLRNALRDLMAALEAYEVEGGKESAFSARDAYRAVLAAAPDGGDRISQFMRSHYFNYNFQLVTTEGFVNKLIKQERTDSGPVRDFILGARVSGTQTTNSNVTVDFKDGSNAAKINLKLSGVTRSRTRGVTSQATIFTSGYHQFWAHKPLTYDGKTLSAAQASIRVNASNTTTGAQTGIPIFGNSIAMSEARKKRGESEAIARSRVRDRVLPEFNREVDSMVKDANKDLESKFYTKLKDAGLYPSASIFRTNESFMRVSTRTATEDELAGGSPPSSSVPKNGISVQIHESLLNNAIDKMALRGEELTQKQVIEEFERSLGFLLGKELDLSKRAEEEESDEAPIKYVFDKDDPIRFKIDDGELRMSIKAGFKQEGEEDIPTQTITIPLSLSVEGKNVQLTRGNVQVAGEKLNIARTAVIRKKLESAIKDRTIDGNIELPANKDRKKEIVLSINSIDATDGWLTVTVN